MPARAAVSSLSVSKLLVDVVLLAHLLRSVKNDCSHSCSTEPSIDVQFWAHDGAVHQTAADVRADWMNHAAYFVDIFICAPMYLCTSAWHSLRHFRGMPPAGNLRRALVSSTSSRRSWWTLAQHCERVASFPRYGGHARVTQHASPESCECERLGSGYARSTSRPSTHPPQPWNASEMSAVIPLATRHPCAAGVILPACSPALLGLVAGARYKRLPPPQTSTAIAHTGFYRFVF